MLRVYRHSPCGAVVLPGDHLQPERWERKILLDKGKAGVQYVTRRLHIVNPQVTQFAPPEVAVFAAIADPTRRAILERLAAGEMAAGRIAGAFPISRPAVSKHLRVLRHADLVQEERRGRRRVYRLNARPLREVAHWLEQYRTFWEKNLASLKLHVETQVKE